MKEEVRASAASGTAPLVNGANELSPPSGQVSTDAGHTPGPWSIDPANGDIVSGPYNVAILYACKPEDKFLMASAPELLAVLERVNSELAHHGRVEVGTALACRVSEVIALAKVGA